LLLAYPNKPNNCHKFSLLLCLSTLQILHLAAAGHRVIAPDLPGFGASDKPAGLQHYKVEAVVQVRKQSGVAFFMRCTALHMACSTPKWRQWCRLRSAHFIPSELQRMDLHCIALHVSCRAEAPPRSAAGHVQRTAAGEVQMGMQSNAHHGRCTGIA
jgi:hypothetical protein